MNLTSDARLTYWLKNRSVQNFGDLLSEVLFEALTSRSLFDWRQGKMTGDYDVVRLLGSIISNWHIEMDLEHSRAGADKPLAYWGCGLRSDEPLQPDRMARCNFLGVRGPLTRDVLGLPSDTPIGDPGLLLPFLYSPKPNQDFLEKTICVPHFLEKKSDEELLAMTGCDLILRPNLAGGRESVGNFLDSLSSAKLVLAGALHAAIVAHAYGKAFAYFDSGYIDVPFKWRDFAASIHMPPEFVKTVDAGSAFYKTNAPMYTMPQLGALLACAPYRAPRQVTKKVEMGAWRPSTP
jgi:hypothetical protein